MLGVTFYAKMTFEKLLRSVSSAAAQRFVIMRKSWQVFHDRSLLLRYFWSSVLPILEYCSAADSHLNLNYWTELSGVLVFQLVVFQSATLHIVDLQQSCACYLRLRVTQCILRAVHCLCRMCRRVLLVVLWLLIDTLSRLLLVGLPSITEPLCPSRCLFGTILVTLCLMMWNWRPSRAEPMLSCWHDLLFIFCLLIFYIFLPSMDWLCMVGVFGLIQCSHSLPALHSRLQFNNNNNNNNNKVELLNCDWSSSSFIEANFSKFTHSNQNYWNDFVFHSLSPQ